MKRILCLLLVLMVGLGWQTVFAMSWDAQYTQLSARLSSLYATLSKLNQQKNSTIAALNTVKRLINLVSVKIEEVKKDIGAYSDRSHPDYWVQLKELRNMQERLEASLAAIERAISQVTQQIEAIKAALASLERAKAEHEQAIRDKAQSFTDIDLSDIDIDVLEELVDFVGDNGYMMVWEFNDEIIIYANQPDIPFGQGQGRYYSTYSDDGIEVLSPLVLDLDGDGKLEASQGNWLAHKHPLTKLVQFDIDGDGQLEAVEWIGPNDGLLLTYDGGPVNGHNLFGDLDGYADGYAKLATLDRNGDKCISGKELDGLYVWQDKNGNAKVEDGEITPVKELGITVLHTRHHQKVSYFIQNGQKRTMWDWYPCFIEKNKQ